MRLLYAMLIAAAIMLGGLAIGCVIGGGVIGFLYVVANFPVYSILGMILVFYFCLVVEQFI
jgi:hypothetical protein